MDGDKLKQKATEIQPRQVMPHEADILLVTLFCQSKKTMCI